MEKYFLYVVGGTVNGTAIKEVSMGVPQKLKIEVLYNPAISLGVYLKDSKSPYHRYLDIHFYCGTIHNS